MPAEFKDLLLECVTGAGHILREQFGQNHEVRRKESQSSVVTEVDVAAEEYILGLTQRRFPRHNIIAEESGFQNHGAELTWVIDPLDGTSNFAAGIPWFGAMVAVLQGAHPVQAAMYLPMCETLYYSEIGGGVWRNGRQVHVSRETDLSQTLCAYGFDSSDQDKQTQHEVELLTRLATRVRNVRCTNSLVDFCYTIDGRLGACLNQATKIWDIAPAHLMLKEAGGRLTDLQGEEIAFKLDTECCRRNYAVIGASEVLLPQVLAVTNSASRGVGP